MLLFADEITNNDIKDLCIAFRKCDASEEVTLSSSDCFAKSLEDGSYVWDSLELAHEGIFAGLGNKMNTGWLTAEDRRSLIAQLDGTCVLDDHYSAECKRQLIMVRGEYKYNKADSMLWCIFLRWFVDSDGTKHLAPAQFVNVTVKQCKIGNCEGMTSVFSSEYTEIDPESLPKCSIDMFKNCKW